MNGTLDRTDGTSFGSFFTLRIALIGRYSSIAAINSSGKIDMLDMTAMVVAISIVLTCDIQGSIQWVCQ